MNDDQKNIDDKFRQWHYWWLVTFSLLLIITFVYYLPLRFLYQATTDDHDEMVDDHMEMMDGEDMHGGHGETVFHEEEDIKEGIAVHLDAYPIYIQNDPIPISTATTTRLDFFVHTRPDNAPVLVADLEIEHEKLMHVIGVRSDMNEFFHIHPEQRDVAGLFTVDQKFSKPGRYKIWSEIKKDNVIHSFGHEPIMVEGEGPREEKKVSFSRSAVVNGYQVALLLEESLGKNVEYDLSFDIHDENGNEVEVENYLGAAMHLSIIKDDWTEFIHTHPEGAHTHAGFQFINKALAHGGAVDEHNAEENDETINFHATFPKAGLYRAFAQFRPAGSNLPADEALTAAFWIRVEEKAVPPPVSPIVSARQSWWALLVVSLILIVILSRFVKKYIGEDI